MSQSDRISSPTRFAGRAHPRFARDSIVLALGSAVAGLLVFVFFAVTVRSLGANGAAPVFVLWSFWALAAAVLTFAVQHWAIRTLTHDGHGAAVKRSLPTVLLAGAVLAATAGVLAYVFGPPLFGIAGLTYPALISGITAGSLFIGLVRGVLAGRRRYAATALSVAGENAVRVAGALVAALAGADAEVFGLVLVGGSLVGLLWLPGLRLDAVPGEDSVDGTPGGPVNGAAGRGATRGRSGNPLALASGLAGGSLIAQLVLTGAPVVLAAVGGTPAEVTSLFVALAVWRTPNILVIGISPRFTAVVTRLALTGRTRTLAWLRWSMVLAALGGAGTAVLVGWTVLAPALQLAFGAGIVLPAWALAALGAGSAAAFGNLGLLLMLLAFGRPHAATLSWGAALAVAVGWLGVSGAPPMDRVVTAFVLAQATALVLLTVTSRIRARRP